MAGRALTRHLRPGEGESAMSAVLLAVGVATCVGLDTGASGSKVLAAGIDKRGTCKSENRAAGWCPSISTCRGFSKGVLVFALTSMVPLSLAPAYSMHAEYSHKDTFYTVIFFLTLYKTFRGTL